MNDGPVPESRGSRLRASGFSYVIAALGSVILQVLAVRHVGVDSYGVYAATISAVALAELTALNRGGELALGTLGAAWHGNRQSSLRALSKQLARVDVRWVASCFALLILVTWCFSGALGLSVASVAIAAMSLPLQIGYGADKALLVVSGRIVDQAKAEVIISLFTLFTSAILLLAFGLVGLLAAYPLAAGFKMMVVRHRANLVYRTMERHDSVAALPEAMSGAVESTITLRNIFMTVADQIDVLIINALGGSVAAGHYRIAKSLASLPARVAGPIWTALRPELAQAWFEANWSRLRRLIIGPATRMAALLLLGLPIVWLAVPTVVAPAYGIESENVAWSLVILLVGTWINQGMSGWLRFMILLDSDKLRSLRWYGLLVVWTAAAGVAWGGHSATRMAIVVALGQVGVAAAATAWMLFVTRARNTRDTAA
jgi:O-antigen/teichoic acid export membrane protein